MSASGLSDFAPKSLNLSFVFSLKPMGRVSAPGIPFSAASWFILAHCEYDRGCDDTAKSYSRNVVLEVIICARLCKSNGFRGVATSHAKDILERCRYLDIFLGWEESQRFNSRSPQS